MPMATFSSLPPPATPPKTEAQRAQEFYRMRRIAGGLLAAMAVVLVAARYGERAHDWAWLGYVDAFSEAALVGALADWFAVTALFRYPLGLKIPHTAIIPRNKPAIGRGLGRFVEDNFLIPEKLEEKIRSFDIIGRAEEWLAKSENAMRVASSITHEIRDLASSTDDENVRKFFQQNLTQLVDRVNVADLSGRFLATMVNNDQDHRLFDELLKALKVVVDENRDLISSTIRSELPPLVKAFSGRVNDRVIESIYRTIDDVTANPEHPLRKRFLGEVNRFVDRLNDDPDFRAKVEGFKKDLLGNPDVQAYFERVWEEIKVQVVHDANKHHSEIKRRIFRALYGLSNSLLNDPVVRERLNNYIYEASTNLVVANRTAVAGFIQQTVENWDETEITNKLELLVGKDLQYIRINGTLVGGTVGLVLHGGADLLEILFGS